MIDAIQMVSASSPLAQTHMPSPSAVQVNEATPSSFGEMLTQLTTSAVGKIEQAENLSVAKMSGAEVPLREIVNSVLEAQQTLNTTLAIRDKIVQAYLEISHMQI